MSRSILALSLVLTAALSSSADTLLIDQAIDPAAWPQFAEGFGVTLGPAPNFSTPLFQAFVPTTRRHVAVDLYVRIVNPQLPEGPLSILLREGSSTGAILGGGSATPSGLAEGFARIFLDSETSLTPYQTYVIEGTGATGRWAWTGLNTDVYPATPSQDFSFRTIVVPEPATAGLLAVSATMLAALRRRRCQERSRRSRASKA